MKLRAFILFALLANLFHVPNLHAEELTDRVFRAATRFAEVLLDESPPGTLFLFPGRSHTLVSIVAESKGARVLNIPGSGMTELQAKDPWNNPNTAPQLGLYRDLVAAELKRACDAGRPAKIVIVDAAQGGGSLVFFHDLIQRIQAQSPELKDVPVASRFTRTPDFNEAARTTLESVGARELNIAVPRRTSGLKLTHEQNEAWIDRYYFEEYEAELIAEKGSNVPSFDPLKVDPLNPDSVRDYRLRFQERNSAENAKLRQRMNQMAAEVPVSGTTRPFLNSDNPCWRIEALGRAA